MAQSLQIKQSAPDYIVKEKLKEVYSVVKLEQVSMDGQIKLEFSSELDAPNFDELRKLVSQKDPGSQTLRRLNNQTDGIEYEPESV